MSSCSTKPTRWPVCGPKAESAETETQQWAPLFCFPASKVMKYGPADNGQKNCGRVFYDDINNDTSNFLCTL